MLYEGILGSRACGLSITDKSDLDIGIITNESCSNIKINSEVILTDNYHYIKNPKDLFIKRFTSLNGFTGYDNQWLYPLEFLPTMDANFKEYLLENRHEILDKNKKIFYNNTLKFASSLEKYHEIHYDLYPKRFMYSIYWYNLLADFKEKLDYSEVMIPNEDMKQKMLAIRNKELPYKDYLLILEECKNKALKELDFFNSFDIDINYHELIKEELSSIIEEYYLQHPNEMR